jgi:CheY-like chemotaxis protein
MSSDKNGGSRFLEALASRLGLGLVQTGVFQEGDHEVHEYRGLLGVRVRRRKPAGQAQSLDAVAATVLEATNGHASQHNSLSSLASRLVAAELAIEPAPILTRAAHAGGSSIVPMPIAPIERLDPKPLPEVTFSAGFPRAIPPAVVETPQPTHPEAIQAEASATPATEPSAEPATEGSERPVNGRHPILCGKTVAVAGFSPADAALLGTALAGQYCSFLVLSHEEAEFKKGATTGCDLLILQAKPEWGEPGVLYPGSALKSKRAALIVGDRAALNAVALWTHGGPREFIPAPWTAEDTIWRAAMLLMRMDASKTRRGKKTGRKLVVIGDADTSASTLLHAVLAQEGIACHAAENGVDTLALAKSKQADAVIVDVSLPGLDGFQVLAELKRDPAMKNTVTILLTARQAEADVLRGFGLGADDYITKPFSPMEVTARLKRFLLRKP